MKISETHITDIEKLEDKGEYTIYDTESVASRRAYSMIAVKVESCRNDRHLFNIIYDDANCTGELREIIKQAFGKETKGNDWTNDAELQRIVLSYIGRHYPEVDDTNIYKFVRMGEYVLTPYIVVDSATLKTLHASHGLNRYADVKVDEKYFHYIQPNGIK